MMGMKILLETDRLTLRAATLEDVDNLYKLNSEPEVMRYINGGQPTSKQEISDGIIPFWINFYKRGDGLGYWIAQARGNQEFLGWFHFRPGIGEGGGVELGYRLRQACWDRGYATEGVARPGPQGLHRHGRRPGIRAHDDGQYRITAGHGEVRDGADRPIPLRAIAGYPGRRAR